MCIRKVKLIYHHRLPILMLLYVMLLYIMLYIMLAYLMLLAALSNAICLYNAFILLLIFTNAFCFHALSWLLAHSLFISCIILHHALCF